MLKLPAARRVRRRHHCGCRSSGLFIQVLLINRILGRSSFFNAAMIATVGAAIMIDSLALLIFGPRVKQMPPIIEGQFKMLGVVIQYQGLVIIAVAAISLIAA